MALGHSTGAAIAALDYSNKRGQHDHRDEAWPRLPAFKFVRRGLRSGQKASLRRERWSKWLES